MRLEKTLGNELLFRDFLYVISDTMPIHCVIDSELIQAF